MRRQARREPTVQEGTRTTTLIRSTKTTTRKRRSSRKRNAGREKTKKNELPMPLREVLERSGGGQARKLMDGWMDGCVSPSLVLTLFFIHANTEHKAAKAAQYDARRREKEAAREAAELAEEEERRRAEEEREAADQKEYEQWRGAFSVEEQGQSLMQTRAL